MSGRVIHLEGDAHVETERLLPWLVNGTLKGEEAALVQSHLEDCAACRQEAAWLRSLQTAYATVEPPAMTGRLHGKLRRRMRAARGGIRARHGRRRHWPFWALAAETVLVLVMGMALWRTAPPAVTYHVLGAAEAPPAQLVVAFDPSLSEAQMRRLLRASGARIVYGPTDTGAYELDVPAGRVRAVSEALRAAPGVTLVQRLGPDDGH